MREGKNSKASETWFSSTTMIYGQTAKRQRKGEIFATMISSMGKEWTTDARCDFRVTNKRPTYTILMTMTGLTREWFRMTLSRPIAFASAIHEGSIRTGLWRRHSIGPGPRWSIAHGFWVNVKQGLDRITSFVSINHTESQIFPFLSKRKENTQKRQTTQIFSVFRSNGRTKNPYSEKVRNDVCSITDRVFIHSFIHSAHQHPRFFLRNPQIIFEGEFPSTASICSIFAARSLLFRCVLASL